MLRSLTLWLSSFLVIPPLFQVLLKALKLIPQQTEPESHGFLFEFKPNCSTWTVDSTQEKSSINVELTQDSSLLSKV